MKIIRLDLISFGRFNNYTIEFGDKFNLIYGLNESGKTTISKFIEGVFYGFVKPYLKRTVFTEDYEKYRPWNSENYEGSVLVEKDNKRYVIYRNFKEKYFNIFNETTGNNETELDGFNQDNLSFPGEYFFKMPSDIFKSTVFSNLKELDAENKNVSSIVDMLLNSSDSNNDSVSFKKALDNLEKMKSNIGTKQSKAKPLGSLYQKKFDLEDEIKNINKDKKEYEDSLNKLNEYKLRHEKLLLNKEKLVNLHKKNDIEKIEDAKNYKMQILKEKASLLDKVSKIKYINDIDEDDVNNLEYQNKLLNDNRITFNELSKEKKLLSKDYYQLKAKLSNYETIRDYIDEVNNLIKKLNGISKLKIKLLIIGVIVTLIIAGMIYMTGYTKEIVIAPVLFVLYYILVSISNKFKKLSYNRQLNKIVQKVNQITNMSYKNYNEVINDFRYDSNMDKSIDYLSKLEVQLQDIDSKLDSIINEDESSKSKINNILSSSRNLKNIDVEDYRRKKIEYNQLMDRISDKDAQLQKISSEYDFSILLEDVNSDSIKLEDNDIKDINLLNKEIDESIEENAKLFERTKILEKSVNLLLEKEERLADINENIQKYESEITSIELAMDLINKSINKLHKNFIPRINKKVSEMMAYSTKYKDKFRVDENLDVSIYDGVKFYEQKHLSSGTFDLLSVFIRISVLEELMGLDYLMILDDCFVQLDDVRYKKCLDLLFKISNNNQIILFSCQNRDEQLLNELDIIYKKIELK
ncbi:AAA family ATPase [Finegoldia sp. BIOML-A3]|uniref:ATP-binding protein n=1 Tax=unclassified Finegoldia TaxID=2619637 RepID=UPI0012B03C4E|nr:MULTISPECIES: AAA family ATPase [unclassified Finegoldia]MSA98284.1 AAA family ATPase [Finegoldia sp. BIOML-A3]MSB92292.1 AAA family ATPase [Finegoldia sp. BIOML-A4]